MKLDCYETGRYYDEMFAQDSQPRVDSQHVAGIISGLPFSDLQQRQRAAERALFDTGITFNVAGGQEGIERIIPFDIIPRIISAEDWQRIERGLKQRVIALNHFVQDVYNEQQIVRDGVFPAEVLATSKGFLQACVGLTPPKGIWCHVAGSDVVRDEQGQFYVLEDNLSVPSGVSYVLSSRDLMKRTFPEIFSRGVVRPVDDYPDRLLEVLQYIAPAPTGERPVVGVWTPGNCNSAYYEHSFLAQQMGVELVEGRDLVVSHGDVCMRTTAGLRRIDVLYRRLNDAYIDPQVFLPDSRLGVPGLMEAYREGRIGLANAPGTGVADDKVVYAYVPDMIRYYLAEDPILANVPTYLCYKKKDLQYALEHLEHLVVKPAHESGGYGMLVGPSATRQERAEFRERLRADPRNYVAQPTLSLSRVPVLVEDRLEGRHVDLRPFVLLGEDVYVMPGGLTRVALKKDSLVVNSSQGGGSKDTWVLTGDREAEAC